MPAQGLGNVPQTSGQGLKKVLFFTATGQMTANEAISYNNYMSGSLNGFEFEVRSAADDPGGSHVESDIIGVCAYNGVTIPTRYSTLLGTTLKDLSCFVYGMGELPKILAPGLAAFSFAHTTTQQLALVSTDAYGDVLDLTKSFSSTETAVNTAWTSASTGVATIGANTGLVTGVAAGTTVITASLTMQDGKVFNFTKTLTLT